MFYLAVYPIRSPRSIPRAFAPRSWYHPNQSAWALPVLANDCGNALRTNWRTRSLTASKRMLRNSSWHSDVRRKGERKLKRTWSVWSPLNPVAQIMAGGDSWFLHVPSGQPDTATSFQIGPHDCTAHLQSLVAEDDQVAPGNTLRSVEELAP